MAEADSHAAAQPPANSSADKATLTGTLLHLWPYIWPGDRADLKMRVVWSMVLLLIAKLATLTVPFTFKWATDALTGANTAPVEASNWMLWLVAPPLLMTIGYGGVRVLMAVLTQLRDGIFRRDVANFFLEYAALVVDQCRARLSARYIDADEVCSCGAHKPGTRRIVEGLEAVKLAVLRVESGHDKAQRPEC